MVSRVVIAALIVFFTTIAAAQQHDHATLGDAGRFYQGWYQPNPWGPQRSVSCCSNRDCAQAEVRQRNGQWEFLSRFSMQWTPIPSRLLEQNQPDPRESPDGFAHVCQNPANLQVLCVVLGTQF